MNAAFKSMSDLLADAEDLVAKVVHSQTPEVRALANTVQLFVNHMNERLRQRARGLPPSKAAARAGLENPWLYIAAGASLVVGIAALVRRQRRNQP
jgi:hypothetical protein